MSSFKVLDEKYTKPSSLSVQVQNFTAKIFTELFPMANNEKLTNTTIKVGKRHPSSKRKICACVCNNTSHKVVEDSLCEIFKKLRLDSNELREQKAHRVNHSNNCKSTNRGCCTVQQNFGGASKSLEVDREKLKLSKIPKRVVTGNNTIEKIHIKSKIPIPLSRQVTSNQKIIGEKSLEKRREASKVHSSELKSCMRSTIKTSPYLEDIMNTFPKTQRKVSFNEFVDDIEKSAIWQGNYRKRRNVTKSPPERRSSLPPWKY